MSRSSLSRRRFLGTAAAAGAGFRVPTVIVSPYARRSYVSHVTHDLTSILKHIETRWNLPAISFRDANANNLLDTLDLEEPPAFLEPPALPATGLESMPSGCTPGDPAEIPPPSAFALPQPPHERRIELLRRLAR